MQRKTQPTLSSEQLVKHATARKSIEAEFPPKKRTATKTAKGSIAYRLREAREAQGLTWYAVAKAAGVPNSGTIRDIEAGNDAKLSNIEAIAKVLGLRLELEPAG